MQKPRNLRELITGESRLSEIIRFGIVGGVATVIQYLVYLIFVEMVGVKAVPSTIISYAISFLFNYVLSTYFTFHKTPTASNGLGFTLSHLVNMGLQTGFVAIFKEIMPAQLALLPALAICIPVNYCLVRFAFTKNIFAQKKK